MRRKRLPFPKAFSPEWVERFWSRVIKNDGCWSWSGVHNKTGYGSVSYYEPGGPRSGVTYLVHRVVDFLERGPCSSHLVIRHMCHNPGCCNPNHLKRGTHKQNRQDSILIGRIKPQHIGDWARGRKGAAHPRSRYCDETRAQAVRLVFSDGMSRRSAAEFVGCHRYSVNRWCREYEESLLANPREIE